MSSDPVAVQLVSTLGVAAPLVVILLYLLRQATEERQRVTDRFLATLDKHDEESTAARVRSAAALETLATTVREHDRRAGDEHARIVEAIERVGSRM